MIFSSTNKATVLVVDDEPINIEVLATLLSREYQVKVASSGLMALDIARREPQPDLILLDIMMPGLDGFEVCRQLKMSPKTQDIPVIFVTAAGAKSEGESLMLGAVDYISKPINKLATELRVRTHIQLARTQKNLQQNLAFLFSMIENLPLAIFVLSLNRQWLYINRPGRRIFECENVEELKQVDPLSLIDEHDREHFDAANQRIIQGESECENLDLQIVGKNSHRSHLDLRLSAVKNPEGKVIAMQGIAIDIARI